MTEATRETVEINICGQICPSTLLTTLREVNNYKQLLRSGEIQLDILTDNHDSTNRIHEVVSNMGYLVEINDQQKYFQITIAKMQPDGKSKQR